MAAETYKSNAKDGRYAKFKTIGTSSVCIW